MQAHPSIKEELSFHPAQSQIISAAHLRVLESFESLLVDVQNDLDEKVDALNVNLLHVHMDVLQIKQDALLSESRLGALSEHWTTAQAERTMSLQCFVRYYLR